MPASIAPPTYTIERGRARQRVRPRPPLLESARESPVPRFNEFYLNLNQSYLFAEIRRRTKVFTDAHPDVRLVDLGVGDVTQPLPPAVMRAMHEAADDMARRETFKGYGPYVGYEFLRAEIAAHDFGSRGVTIALDEVFVSDGGKSDSANLQEIFAADSVVALMDPVYPVYADSNVVAGRAEGAARTRRRWPVDEPQRALGASHGDQVQRTAVRHPEGRRRRVHVRGPEAGTGADRLLHGERADHRRGTRGRGARRLRRPQRAVHLGPHAALRLIVGFLRQGPGGGTRGRRAGRRLRPQRRGLLPPHRVRFPPADRRGRRADQGATVRGPRPAWAARRACALASVWASWAAVAGAIRCFLPSSSTTWKSCE